MKSQVALFVAVLLLNLVAMGAMVEELSRMVAPLERIAGAQTKAVMRVPSEVSAFETSPTVDSWRNVEDEIANKELPPAFVRRLVEVLAYRDLPRRLINSIVVDLSGYDMTDSLRWLHEINLVAGTERSADGAAVVRRTAHVCWLLLALRPSYGTAGIDLTRMDLRYDAPFVGQRMNLTYIDFTNADLPAGTWDGSNLSASLFTGVRTTGLLRCSHCTFGNRRVVPEAALVGGKWIVAGGSKETP